MFKTIITGNVGQGAEVKRLDSGRQVINFTVANTQRVKKNGDWTDKTTWVDVQKWVNEDGSTKIADFLTKGTKVLVEGEVSARGWVKDGEAKTVLVITAKEIELLGGGERTQNTTNHPTTTVQDDSSDLPF